MNPFEQVEPKTKYKEDTEQNEATEGIPDAVKDMLVEALKGSSEAVQRAKCLQMALELPDLSGPDEAIQAAEKFRKYIMENAQ